MANSNRFSTEGLAYPEHSGLERRGNLGEMLVPSIATCTCCSRQEFSIAPRGAA